MNAACDRCLAAIINASPAPLALVAGGVVTLANRHFADLAGLPPEKTAGCAPGALFPGLGLEGLVPETILRNHAHTVERTITVAGRQASIWAQILPVSAMEGGAALLTAVDTSALHRGQVALLQQMRKTRTDNIWVFDAELRVVYAELEPELQALRGRPDFHPLRLLQPGQEAGARQALREAKDNPGRQVSVVLRTRRESGRLITVYADIIFCGTRWAATICAARARGNCAGRASSPA